MQPPPRESSTLIDPPAASAAGTGRVAITAVIAWGLLSISAAASEPAGALRSGGVLALVVAAVALARWGAFRRASAVALALYAGGLTSATLITGAGWPAVGDAARVQILTGNPNVLAAALVTAFAGWAAVAPRRRWVWWGWPLVALAVLHTGSRTAGGALLAAGALWVVAQAMRHRPKLVLAPLIALAVLAAAALAWQRGVVELTPNLLTAPSDLSDPAWRHDLAQSIIVVDEAAPGPMPGTTAQRLIAQSNPDGGMFLYQSLGRSESGVPYVASIHLRADEPQRLVLTSHLARVTCEVEMTWSRCVTPVGYGDDRAQRQLQLRAADRGGGVDVYVFGAQYERGVAATPFVDARPTWVPQAMVNRYDLRRATLLPSSRIVAWQAGLQIAREHPWFGIGLEASRDAFRERTRDALSRPVTYAHNLLVQLLAVHGLVGLLGVAIVVAAVLSTLSRTGWLRVAPLLVGLALLNTWDVTLFEPTVFVAALLATAYWTAEREAAP